MYSTSSFTSLKYFTIRWNRENMKIPMRKKGIEDLSMTIPQTGSWECKNTYGERITPPITPRMRSLFIDFTIDV
jgi:hypothetical protein